MKLHVRLRIAQGNGQLQIVSSAERGLTSVSYQRYSHFKTAGVLQTWSMCTCERRASGNSPPVGSERNACPEHVCVAMMITAGQMSESSDRDDRTRPPRMTVVSFLLMPLSGWRDALCWRCPRQCSQHFRYQLEKSARALGRSWSCGAAMLTCYSCQRKQFLRFIVTEGGLTYDTQCQKNLLGVGMPVIFLQERNSGQRRKWGGSWQLSFWTVRLRMVTP